ncbi:MAG: D-alanyl-D-alanine carboxypeptidase, partial [bacterium]|nr:D-alanyl-D-alanine carboxypeptidase [bacterium]
MIRRTLTVVLVFFTLISSVHAKKRLQSSVFGPRSSYYAIVAETGEVVGRHNENLSLNPASNVKLVTAYCSLKTLGPDYRFKTDFFTDTPITDGTLHNLWVRGGGDPSLVNENLETIVGILKAHGLKKIAGNVIVDASFFDNADYPGRKEDNERPYNAKTSAASLNHNAAEIFVEGTKKGPIVYLSPNISYFKIKNHLRISSKRARVR